VGIPITIKGNLGKDPDLKFHNNKPYVTFSLAHTPSSLVNGEWINEEPIWFTVTQFGEQSEALLDTLKKGDAVLVVGSWKPHSYKTKEGVDRTGLEIKAKVVGKIAKAITGKNAEKDLTSETPPW
jgi:single-strand DNA-binding protein